MIQKRKENGGHISLLHQFLPKRDKLFSSACDHRLGPPTIHVVSRARRQSSQPDRSISPTGCPSPWARSQAPRVAIRTPVPSSGALHLTTRAKEYDVRTQLMCLFKQHLMSFPRAKYNLSIVKRWKGIVFIIVNIVLLVNKTSNLSIIHEYLFTDPAAYSSLN